jgi:hypothetical protein
MEYSVFSTLQNKCINPRETWKLQNTRNIAKMLKVTNIFSISFHPLHFLPHCTSVHVCVCLCVCVCVYVWVCTHACIFMHVQMCVMYLWNPMAHKIYIYIYVYVYHSWHFKFWLYMSSHKYIIFYRLVKKSMR